ncbi:MAG: GNAT family N-acetyltransferase [Burkholderiales bacterium]|nr:GNAT family N-acetyltransferase [Burkholderiales bacterium]
MRPVGELLPIDREPSVALRAAAEAVEPLGWVLQATLDLYARRGYQPPWIGHVWREDDAYRGSCGWAGPPDATGEVELAYFSFPGHEGQGVATRMARALLAQCFPAAEGLRLIAHTLPQEGPSCRILRGLGFECLGPIEHPDDGTVWKWREPAQVAAEVPEAALLQRLAAMPAELHSALSGLDTATLRRQPPQDRSPLHEHAFHLWDCEARLYAPRIRRTLGETLPWLAPMAIGAWVKEHGYFNRPLVEGLEGFAQARGALVETLRALAPADWGRLARRADGRHHSVRALMDELLAHDEDHRQRIAAILAV